MVLFPAVGAAVILSPELVTAGLLVGAASVLILAGSLKWVRRVFSSEDPGLEWPGRSQSDSVRPHRRQPTRLCHPWDSPDKNTGVPEGTSHGASDR